MKFLDVDHVLAIHEAVLGTTGGEDGGGPRGSAGEGAEAAVQAVKNSYYDTVEELAAAYAVYIVQGHVFLDGNKRTGAMAMMTFLDNNGIDSSIAQHRLSSAMIELQERARNGERTDQLVSWLASLL